MYVCVARQLSSTLSCEVHGSQSGQHVTAKMMELVMNNFALSSTTVTGIPMKVGIVETRQKFEVLAEAIPKYWFAGLNMSEIVYIS